MFARLSGKSIDVCDGIQVKRVIFDFNNVLAHSIAHFLCEVAVHTLLVSGNVNI